GAQGEPAYRLRLRAAVVDLLVKHPAHQARALAAQRGGAAVNVIVAGAAGGELELAQVERLLGQHLQQQFARSGHLEGRLSWPSAPRAVAERDSGAVSRCLEKIIALSQALANSLRPCELSAA